MSEGGCPHLFTLKLSCGEMGFIGEGVRQALEDAKESASWDDEAATAVERLTRLWHKFEHAPRSETHDLEGVIRTVELSPN